MSRLHSQLKEHHNRNDLSGEHKLGDAGQVAIALLFAAVWVIDTFFFKCTTFLDHYIPPFIKIPLGIALFIISGYMARTGLNIVFKEVREEPCVIRKGVFNLVRHPIYLSEILLYLGMLLISFSLAAAVVWVIAIIFLHYISRHEEKLLLARFGEEYKRYIREVPMWIPGLKGR